MRNDLAFVFMVFGSGEFRFHLFSPEPSRKVSGNFLGDYSGECGTFGVHKTPDCPGISDSPLLKTIRQPKRLPNNVSLWKRRTLAQALMSIWQTN